MRRAQEAEEVVRLRAQKQALEKLARILQQEARSAKSQPAASCSDAAPEPREGPALTCFLGPLPEDGELCVVSPHQGPVLPVPRDHSAGSTFAYAEAAAHNPTAAKLGPVALSGVSTCDASPSWRHQSGPAPSSGSSLQPAGRAAERGDKGREDSKGARLQSPAEPVGTRPESIDGPPTGLSIASRSGADHDDGLAAQSEPHVGAVETDAAESECQPLRQIQVPQASRPPGANLVSGSPRVPGHHALCEREGRRVGAISEELVYQLQRHSEDSSADGKTRPDPTTPSGCENQCGNAQRSSAASLHDNKHGPPSAAAKSKETLARTPQKGTAQDSPSVSRDLAGPNLTSCLEAISAELLRHLQNISPSEPSMQVADRTEISPRGGLLGACPSAAQNRRDAAGEGDPAVQDRVSQRTVHALADAFGDAMMMKVGRPALSFALQEIRGTGLLMTLREPFRTQVACERQYTPRVRACGRSHPECVRAADHTQSAWERQYTPRVRARGSTHPECIRAADHT